MAITTHLATLYVLALLLIAPCFASLSTLRSFPVVCGDDGGDCIRSHIAMTSTGRLLECSTSELVAGHRFVSVSSHDVHSDEEYWLYAAPISAEASCVGIAIVTLPGSELVRDKILLNHGTIPIDEAKNYEVAYALVDSKYVPEYGPGLDYLRFGLAEEQPRAVYMTAFIVDLALDLFTVPVIEGDEFTIFTVGGGRRIHLNGVASGAVKFNDYTDTDADFAYRHLDHSSAFLFVLLPTISLANEDGGYFPYFFDTGIIHRHSLTVASHEETDSNQYMITGTHRVRLEEGSVTVKRGFLEQITINQRSFLSSYLIEYSGTPLSSTYDVSTRFIHICGTFKESFDVSAISGSAVSSLQPLISSQESHSTFLLAIDHQLDIAGWSVLESDTAISTQASLSVTSDHIVWLALQYSGSSIATPEYEVNAKYPYDTKLLLASFIVDKTKGLIWGQIADMHHVENPILDPSELIAMEDFAIMNSIGSLDIVDQTQAVIVSYVTYFDDTCECEFRHCGSNSDECQESCGDCANSQSCEDGLCGCLPDCPKDYCGGDGCGGKCPSTCNYVNICDEEANACVSPEPANPSDRYVMLTMSATWETMSADMTLLQNDDTFRHILSDIANCPVSCFEMVRWRERGLDIEGEFYIFDNPNGGTGKEIAKSIISQLDRTHDTSSAFYSYGITKAHYLKSLEQRMHGYSSDVISQQQSCLESDDVDGVIVITMDTLLYIVLGIAAILVFLLCIAVVVLACIAFRNRRETSDFQALVRDNAITNMENDDDL